MNKKKIRLLHCFGVVAVLCSCNFAKKEFVKHEIEWIPNEDERLQGISNTKNSFFISNGRFVYQPFFGHRDDLFVILNTSQESIYIKEKNLEIKAYRDYILKEAWGVIVTAKTVAIITKNKHNILGLSLIEKGSDHLKKLYPFFKLPKSMESTFQNLKKSRIRHYEDKTIHIKINHFLMIEISKSQKLASWKIFQPKKLTKNFVNSKFVDYFFSKSPKEIYIILKIEQENRKTKHLIAKYDLKEETLEKVTEVHFKRGNYYDVSDEKNPIIITSSYNARRLMYIFDYYDLKHRESVKEKRFLISKETYPLGLYFNGKYLQGFQWTPKGISFNEWR